MVQFCIAGDQDIGVLKSTLQSIAQSKNLRFIDASAQTEADLQAIAEVLPKTPIAHPTIHVGTDGDSLGFGAGNFPEAAYQVVVGFTAGSSRAEAQAFSDTAVARLAEHWKIHEVANVATSGAFPLKSCP